MDKSKLAARIGRLEKQVATGERLRREIERNHEGALWVIKSGLIGAVSGVVLLFGLGLLPGVVLLFVSGVIALLGGLRQRAAKEQLDEVEEGLVEYRSQLAQAWATLVAA